MYFRIKTGDKAAGELRTALWWAGWLGLTPRGRQSSPGGYLKKKIPEETSQFNKLPALALSGSSFGQLWVQNHKFNPTQKYCLIWQLQKGCITQTFSISNLTRNNLNLCEKFISLPQASVWGSITFIPKLS